MSDPKPSISVNVDPTNPGQFFACCGLLELADRLWPGAEGWFEKGQFHVACGGTLAELTTALSQATIESSLTAAELKRLGTLLSVSEVKLTADDLDEKARLKLMWKYERLSLSKPFDLSMDWWRDDRGERTDLKTWAAKQLVAEMTQDMLCVIRNASWSKTPNAANLFEWVQTDSLPFNFDSDLSGAGSARDAGFSADTLGLKASFRPLLELLAFIGLQRFRPLIGSEDKCRFFLWSVPLPPSVAVAAAVMPIGSADEPNYEFSLFSRTKYMKVFLPAKPE
jgi:CRISPR-associated protein Csb3